MMYVSWKDLEMIVTFYSCPEFSTFPWNGYNHRSFWHACKAVSRVAHKLALLRIFAKP